MCMHISICAAVEMGERYRVWVGQHRVVTSDGVGGNLSVTSTCTCACTCVCICACVLATMGFMCARARVRTGVV